MMMTSPSMLKKFLKLSKNECCIIYTDFINNIGPIMSKLQDNGIDSLPYYGEMDAKSRYSNYMKWKNDEINGNCCIRDGHRQRRHSPHC